MYSLYLRTAIIAVMFLFRAVCVPVSLMFFGLSESKRKHDNYDLFLLLLILYYIIKITYFILYYAL